MGKNDIYLDSFTNAGVVDLKKSMRNENGVLNALNINPMVSTWDMSENPWLCRIIDSLKENELIVSEKQEYPWHKFVLTQAGKERITA